MEQKGQILVVWAEPRNRTKLFVGFKATR